MKCVDDESDQSRDAELLIHGETGTRPETESSQLNISDVSKYKVQYNFHI